MKNTLIFLFFILVSSYANAQSTNSNIEKSITGVQLGVFGTELYNESRISKNFALRSEAGLILSNIGGSDGKTNYTINPFLALQPKYYFNINNRAENGKNVKNNSANYFSLQMRYAPNWFNISNDNSQLYNEISLIPTFGIRRNFAKRFNYEFKIGYGYKYTFNVNKGQNASSDAFDIGFKIGYDF